MNAFQVAGKGERTQTVWTQSVRQRGTLPSETMLDLQKMRETGEEIYNLPVSDREMKGVVNSVYEDLPEVE